MTDLEIQKYIENNCRNEHGKPMMNEQIFYEGAKWYRNKVVNKLNIADVSVSLPEQKEIDKAIDKYAFRVLYDGSKDFYDKGALNHFKAGIEWLLGYIAK